MSIEVRKIEVKRGKGVEKRKTPKKKPKKKPKKRKREANEARKRERESVP